MIPSLTPPTDSYSKFIALFGMGILILAIIQIFIKLLELVQSRFEVENIRAQILDKIIEFQSTTIL